MCRRQARSRSSLAANLIGNHDAVPSCRCLSSYIGDNPNGRAPSSYPSIAIAKDHQISAEYLLQRWVHSLGPDVATVYGAEAAFRGGVQNRSWWLGVKVYYARFWLNRYIHPNFAKLGDPGKSGHRNVCGFSPVRRAQSLSDPADPVPQSNNSFCLLGSRRYRCIRLGLCLRAYPALRKPTHRRRRRLRHRAWAVHWDGKVECANRVYIYQPLENELSQASQRRTVPSG